jgi:hypothetical protein
METIQPPKKAFSLKFRKPRSLKKKNSKKGKSTLSIDGSDTRSTSNSISTFNSVSSSISTSSWIRKKISPKKLKKRISKKLSRKSKEKGLIESGLLIESIEIEERHVRKTEEATDKELFNENSTDTSLSDDRADRDGDCPSTPVAHTSHIVPQKVDPVAEVGNESFTNDNENPEQCVDSVFLDPVDRIFKKEEGEMSPKPDSDLDSSTEQMLDTEEIVPMMPIAEVIDTCDDNIESISSKVDEDYLSTTSWDMAVIVEETGNMDEAHLEKTWFQNIFSCCRGQEEIRKEGVIG